MNLVNGFLLPILIVMMNLFAIVFIKKGKEYMIAHQKRAKEVLKKYTPNLLEMEKELPISTPGQELFGRTNVQILLHVLILIIVFIPCIFYFSQLFAKN